MRKSSILPVGNKNSTAQSFLERLSARRQRIPNTVPWWTPAALNALTTSNAQSELPDKLHQPWHISLFHFLCWQKFLIAITFPKFHDVAIFKIPISLVIYIKNPLHDSSYDNIHIIAFLLISQNLLYLTFPIF